MWFFSSDRCEIKKEKDRYIIGARMGNSFKHQSRKILGNDGKLNALFIKAGLFEIIFHDFFVPEVCFLLSTLMKQKHTHGLNVVVYQKILDYFQAEDEALNAQFSIDYDIIKRNFQFSILSHQQAIFKTYEKYKRLPGYRGILLDAEPGTGKAQPLYAKCLTPGGWKEFKDLKVGMKVICPDGTTADILNIFPQGELDIYTVVFEDGRKAECCLEHLWEVNIKNRKKVINTLEMKDLIENEVEVKIPLISKPHDVKSTIRDEDLYEYGRSLAIDKPLKIKKVKEESINPLYLSISNRIAFLSGLNGQKVDIKRDDITILANVSSSMKKRIISIVRSLGGVCFTEHIDEATSFDCVFSTKYLKVKSITLKGPEKAQCIKISHPRQLYITDKYVVTHNTFSSLALAEGSHAKKVVIICPLATVDDVWIKSISGMPGDCVFKEQREYYAIRDGGTYNGQRYILSHYEGMDKCIALAKQYSKDFEGATIIVDESHNLADDNSKRTKNVLDFVDMVNSENVFALSGTPLKSSYREMLTLLSFVYTNFEGPVKKRYLTLYKSPTAIMAEFLQKRYQGVSVKVKKDSIGLEPIVNNILKVKLKDGEKYTLENIRKDLVDFINRRTIELEREKTHWEDTYYRLYEKAKYACTDLSSRELRDYEEKFNRIKRASRADLWFMGEIMVEVNRYETKLAAHLHGEDKKLFREAKTIVKYPILKIQGEALGLIITGARIKCHEELAAAINYSEIINSTPKKTLIFSSYVNVCNAATKKCIEEKYKPTGVYGESVKELSKTVETFTNNPKVNPLIATYKSLSTGVRLTAANVVICLDLPFRLYMYDQAISRVWRLGQDRQVQVYLVKLDTGEEKNINGRTVEIMDFFRKEIEEITGYQAALNVEFGEDGSSDSVQEVNAKAGIAQAAGFSGSKGIGSLASKIFRGDMVPDFVFANEAYDPIAVLERVEEMENKSLHLKPESEYTVFNNDEENNVENYTFNTWLTGGQ